MDREIPLNIKFHRRATTELEEEIYNCVLHDMFNLFGSLMYQATEFQWSDNVGIMMIPKDVSNTNTDYVNLLTNHGEIYLNMIKKLKRNISEINQEQHKIQICCITD